MQLWKKLNVISKMKQIKILKFEMKWLHYIKREV